MQTTAFAPPIACPLGAGAVKVDREELANSLTHALGAVLSVGGLVYLFGTMPRGDWVQSTSLIVFGLALVILYTGYAVG